MADEPLHCRVEIPKGSRNKYEYDEELGAIRLDRFLFSSVVYPTDYGFLPRTRAADGDPLRAVVLVAEPTFPGCVIPVRIVGVLRMTDEDGPDDKVICVPHDDPEWDEVGDMDDVPRQLRDEVEHFFSVYKTLEPDKDVNVGGFEDRDSALRILAEAQRRWRDARQ